MISKLIQIGATGAAVAALVAPATASAGPALTAKSDPGVPIAKGTAIEATSINAVTTGGPLGTMTCDHLALSVEVTKNSAEGMTGGGTGGAAENCKASGTSMTMTEPTLLELSTTEAGKGTLTMTFTADVGPAECHYTGTGTFTYSLGSDVLKISNLPLDSTSELCEPEEPEGQIQFSGHFTLSKTNGDPVRFSNYEIQPPGTPVLTSADKPGVPVPLGSEFEAASTNAVYINTPLGSLTCEHWLWEGEVTENTGSSAAGVGTGGETAVCFAGEDKLTVTNPTLISLQTTEIGKASVSMTFIADVGPVECHYSGSGNATYTKGSDTLNISGVKLKAKSPLCEDEEEDITFSGDFKLTTVTGVSMNFS